MLQNNEINSLTALLDRSHGTLHGILTEFNSMFKGALAIFSATSILANYLNNNILTTKSKIIALYLLIAPYSNESPENHPFIQTLLKVSEETELALQRKIVYDLLYKSNYDNYSGFQVQKYQEIVIKDKQLPKEKEQILILKAKVKEKFKKLKNNVNSVSQSITMMKKDEEEKGNAKIIEQILQMPFLRPVPDFLEIKASQFHWLSPGIITDVEWDNSYEIEKKMEKVRKILYASLTKPLQHKERNQLLNCIESDPYAPLHLGMKPEFIKSLLNHNHYIVSSVIIKLSKYVQVQDYLEMLLFEATSVKLIDVLGRVIRQIQIPEQYLMLFLMRHMNQVTKAQENQERNILAFTLTAFLKCMIENEQINPLEIKTEISAFINEFRDEIDFQPLKIILESK